MKAVSLVLAALSCAVLAGTASGDLHLTGRAASGIAKGRAVPELTDDFDGQKRNPSPDIGADEVRPAPASSSKPSRGP